MTTLRQLQQNFQTMKNSETVQMTEVQDLVKNLLSLNPENSVETRNLVNSLTKDNYENIVAHIIKKIQNSWKIDKQQQQLNNQIKFRHNKAIYDNTKKQIFKANANNWKQAPQLLQLGTPSQYQSIQAKLYNSLMSLGLFNRFIFIPEKNAWYDLKFVNQKYTFPLKITRSHFNSVLKDLKINNYKLTEAYKTFVQVLDKSRIINRSQRINKIFNKPVQKYDQQKHYEKKIKKRIDNFLIPSKINKEKALMQTDQKIVNDIRFKSSLQDVQFNRENIDNDEKKKIDELKNLKRKGVSLSKEQEKKILTEDPKFSAKKELLEKLLS